MKACSKKKKSSNLVYKCNSCGMVSIEKYTKHGWKNKEGSINYCKGKLHKESLDNLFPWLRITQ